MNIEEQIQSYCRKDRSDGIWFVTVSPTSPTVNITLNKLG